MPQSDPARAEMTPVPFIIDVFGWFPPERLTVRFDASPRPTTSDLESLIATEWDRQTELARQSDRMLFNGVLFRYLSHSVDGEGDDARFELTVGPTCYRDFVGTNLFNNHLLERFGWDRFANPIGTTATIITRDGRICLGRRSERVAYHAGHVHTLGGGLEERDRAENGVIDAMGSVARELEEELNLRRTELPGLGCVGLIRDREIHQPELLFEVELGLTASELRSRWLTAEARDEHEDLETLPDEPSAVVPFIKSCGRIAPVAIGALLLHGRARWGESWFHAAASALDVDPNPRR